MPERIGTTMSTQIEIENTITVGDLAKKLMLPVTNVITELFKNGVMVTVNERIDFDTAQIIVGELGLDIELRKVSSNDDSARVKKEISDSAIPRPPVVAVMGHVDHGKTSLLDAIRGAQVAKGEAGGITQHISAYQIEHSDRLITFLDTPGHEAFSALREHGAQLTDLVIIVVAVDDGIKPQTVEAIRFAKKANVKMIVAANKIDKEGADINRLYSQLSEHGLMWDGWSGGDIPVIPISAKTGQGVSELLDMVTLVADVEDLRADIDVPATGLIIEAHMEKGRGAIAEALVESGKIRPGDFIVAGGSYARIRNLESTLGAPMKEALPSSPVRITGFKTLPEFGDEFVSVKDEKTARSMASTSASKSQLGGRIEVNSSELIRIINRSNKINELNLIVKADVQGSLTSVIDSLKTMDTDEVAVRIVGSGVGMIGENDIHLAHSSGAIVYGFNVTVSNSVKHLASRDRVPIRVYKIIYELIDDAKEELVKLLPPEVIEKDMGRLLIKGVFKTTKTEIICGGEVTQGKLVAPALARVLRDGEIIGSVEVSRLQRGPQEAKEVFEGDMCGISLSLSSKLEVLEGDYVELFTREVIARTL